MKTGIEREASGLVGEQNRKGEGCIYVHVLKSRETCALCYILEKMCDFL